ncbi:MAG TPA: immunoglobulin domain-containing protein [Verrucomicrobiae bacterium]|nr:immunoglobulin domain-containing protein [Verrucomicrobiae bacterium]
MTTPQQIKKLANSALTKTSLCSFCFWLGLISISIAGPPPDINLQPTNQTVAVGANATMVVGATSGTALSYQWYFQSTPVTGATNSSYSITNVQLTNAGTYFVAVQNAGGTVNSSNAVLTVVSLVVTNTNDSGPGTLRQAILEANTLGGTNIITFNVAGAGVQAIAPASAFPVITKPVLLDGWSQAGYSGSPLIELNGMNAGTNVSGLVLGAGSAGSTVRGLVINRFANEGLDILSANNLIVGNYIGTDSTGLTNRGNANDGIEIANAANNTIGGISPATRNIISGNGLGIRIAGANATGNSIVGNYIGADSRGASTLGNRLHGIFFSRFKVSSTDIGPPHNNRVGGITAGQGNLIVNNGMAGGGWDGIALFKDGGIVGNSILGNSISGNGGLGIDLANDGVTPNDPGDADPGPNNLQNFPVLSSANVAASNQVSIIGSFNSQPNSYYRIELFASVTTNASNYGEGQRFLGFFNLRTDGSGNASGQGILPASVTPGEFVSATATKSDSTYTNFTDTSEFAQDIPVPSAADVSTTLSGPTSVSAFANVTYSVTVSNRGPSAASNVSAVTSLDSKFTFVSASGGGSYLGGVVSWPAIANLPGGSSTNFTVTVSSPSKGQLTNIASSFAATSDPDSSNNNGTASAARVVTAVTSLKLDKTSSGANVATLNWSHTVSPGSARILIVGVSIDVTNASVLAANFAGLLPLTPIGQTNGTDTRVAMYYLLNPPVGTFPVSVTLDTAAGIVGGAASFQGVDQSSPITAFAGNIGPNDTPTVTVASSLGGFVVDTVAPKSPRRVNSAGPGQVVAWNMSSTNYSGAGSITPGDRSVSPYWILNGNKPWTMAAAALNPSMVLADVALTATGPANVVATSNLTYSITITNRGLSTATNVVVSDALPAGAAFVSASAGGTYKGGIVTWPTLTTFGTRTTAIYSVTITAPGAGPLTNLAYSTSVTADPDPSNNNGTSTNNQVITAVTGLMDVATTLDGPAVAFAGSTFTYTISLTNSGPSPAVNVLVSNSVPAGATFVSASQGGTNNAGLVTWLLSSLAAGAATNLTLTVSTPASGVLTDLVASTSDTRDLVPSNNDGSRSNSQVVTTIIPSADVALTVAGPSGVPAAAAFSYTLTLTNAGPSVASNIVVSDMLPAGVTFLSATAGGRSNGGVVLWPPVPSLPSGWATNLTLTVSAPASGSLTNSGASTSDTHDPITSNNDGSAPASQVVTLVYPPATLSGQLLSGSGFQISISNLANAPISIAASTNLLDWQILVTTNSANGFLIFIDQDVGNYPSRFYRGIQTP